MLKETETEETIVFFVTFLSLVAFQMGEAGPLPPTPGYAYAYHLPIALCLQIAYLLVAILFFNYGTGINTGRLFCVHFLLIFFQILIPDSFDLKLWQFRNQTKSQQLSITNPFALPTELSQP